MLEKLKSLALISTAPFVAGIVVGYVARTPIGWGLDVVRGLIKLM